MWYNLDASDGTACTVHEKNILQAGTLIKEKDKVTFFYNGVEYTGVVLYKNKDHAKCAENLNEISKTRNALKRAPSEPKALPAKRRITPVNLFNSTQSDDGPRKRTEERPSRASASNGKKKTESKGQPMTEAEKARLRILELNKKQAEAVANKLLISKVSDKAKKKSPENDDSDDDWIPPFDDEVSQDSNLNFNAHKKSLKDNEGDLLRNLRKSPSPVPDHGPSKDELMDRIKQLENMLKRSQKKDQTSSEDDHRNRRPLKEDGNEDRSPLHQDGIKDQNSLHEQEDQYQHDEDFGKDDDNTSKDNNEQDKGEGGSSFSAEKGSDEAEDFAIDLDNLSATNEKLEYQLYGKRSDTTAIAKDIYCKTDVLAKALANAKSVNHMVRRLMEGVFIPSKILTCTVTGQSWRAGGEDRVKESHDPLHPRALKAIVDFSNRVAAKEHWKTQKLKGCRAAFSGRLIEIKHLVKKGSLTD